MEQIKIENLTFSFPESQIPALSDINLNIRQGEYVVICGKSGCGKTTLLKHLKPVLTPSGKKNGHIFYDGEEIDKVDFGTISSEIGFVLQNPDNQIVTDKVWHELAFGLENLGFDDNTIRLRVAETACYFGIEDWFHKSINCLSGGQKQILNLASVMAMHPKVLILDEPTSQLDPIAADDFLSTVAKINRESGTTIIITEHRLEEIFPYADKAVVMENGKIIACDTPKNIGTNLKDKDKFIELSMPSAMRIYSGVSNSLECPLTVKEGRDWLSEMFSDKTPEYVSIEKKPFSASESIAVKIKEVYFRYKKSDDDIINNLNVCIPSNSVFAILGGNGAGKSTALKLISDIEKPYRGKIEIFGKNISKFKNNELYTNCISMLPQQVQSLFVEKTVRLDLSDMIDANKSEDEKNQLIGKIAELTEIDDLLDKHPFDLSGGEQQRAALAKVLLTNPKILLLDEPTKGMDSVFKLAFSKILNKLKANGVTVIIVSHDIEFCAKNADICAMMFDGRIVSQSDAGSFFSQNSFYTTAACRISNGFFKNAVSDGDVIELCLKNLNH